IETGLYYYRARYYNPYIGRFLQIDPAYSSMNLYAYCGNNPINCTDPMGLEYLSTTAKITYKLKNDPCEYHIKLKSFKDFNDWLTGLKNSAKTITFFEIITHGAHAPGDTDGLGFMLGMDVFGIGQTNINNPKEKWYGIDDYNSLILSVFDPCATIELEYCYSANGFHCLGKELKKLLPTANIYGYTGKCKQFPGVWETRPVLWGSEWVTINSNGTVAPVTPPIWLSPHYSLAWSDFTPYI
ncbi:MAG: RHS repeat-associated core domain-containing protein, partial [Sedimentisphaerales bacterium]|nr:RHS repeat-associated core domain-containing protein [Sedimentisphaerales bacterium]